MNLELNGMAHKSTIHTVGLGDEDKVEALWMPRINFGGAFIKQGNAYDDSNDTVQRPSDEDYIIQDVQLVDARPWLSDLFDRHQQWRNGLIKIDVEGFELKIFKTLLETLPKKISTVIVMENFLNTIDFQTFAAPNHDLEWFGFYKTKSWFKSIPFKLLGMSSYYTKNVRRIGPNDSPARHHCAGQSKGLKKVEPLASACQLCQKRNTSMSGKNSLALAPVSTKTICDLRLVKPAKWPLS